MLNKKYPVKPKISIDTYHYNIVEKILKFNYISIINDVYGVDYKKIALLLRDRPLNYVFMHHLGTAGSKYLELNDHFLDNIFSFSKFKINNLLNLGMRREQLIFDPGLGFGKYNFHAKNILKNLSRIKQKLDIKILVGHSRKKSITNIDLKDNVTLDLMSAIITNQICNNVDFIRVHNVEYSAIARLIN